MEPIFVSSELVAKTQSKYSMAVYQQLQEESRPDVSFGLLG